MLKKRSITSQNTSFKEQFLVHKKRIKLGLACLLLLCFLILIGKTIAFFTALNQPLTKNLASNKQYQWDGQSVINSVILKKDKNKTSYYVMNFSPKDQKVTLLLIPSLTYTELPRNFGDWKVESIYDLGQEEPKPIGAELLKISISKLLGLPIDSIIKINNLDSENVRDWVEGFRNNRFSVLTTFRHIQTDMTPLESIKLFWALSTIRADKISELNLEQSSITESKLLPDGTRVLNVDGIKLDLFIRDKLFDSAISQEDKTVAFYNATNHPGLTKEAVRLVTNLGATVTTITNAEKLENKTYVYVSDTKDSITAKRLEEIFAPNCLKNDCQSDDGKVAASRAQINIVLGEDYYRFWNEK